GPIMLRTADIQSGRSPLPARSATNITTGFTGSRMGGSTTSGRRSPLERTALVACIAVFSLFLLNLLSARFSHALGIDRVVRLDGVPEFLLLFAAIVFFSIAALAAERRALRELRHHDTMTDQPPGGDDDETRINR